MKVLDFLHSYDRNLSASQHATKALQNLRTPILFLHFESIFQRLVKVVEIGFQLTPPASFDR